MISFDVIQLRRPGAKKMVKPKELRGISHATTLKHSNQRSAVQVFILGRDIYLKYNDYYSPTINPNGMRIGAPLEVKYLAITGKSRPPKFVYGDSWGDVVARQEAWVKISGLVDNLGESHVDTVTSLIKAESDYHEWDYVDMLLSDTERLFDNLVIFLRRYFDVCFSGRYLKSI